MTPCLLGYPLEEAEALLDGMGIRYTLVEVKSKKGVLGNEARIIRQRESICADTGMLSLELAFSWFKTDCDFQSGAPMP